MNKIVSILALLLLLIGCSDKNNPDNIKFVKIFGLVGIDYTKKGSGYINLETYPEIILTAEDTRGGFRNDVFKNHFGLGYRLEIGQTF